MRPQFSHLVVSENGEKSISFHEVSGGYKRGRIVHVDGHLTRKLALLWAEQHFADLLGCGGTNEFLVNEKFGHELIRKPVVLAEQVLQSIEPAPPASGRKLDRATVKEEAPLGSRRLGLRNI